MDFYNIYINLCKEIGKTPSRVAVEAGFSKATVNRWKNGGGCTDANLVALSDYFTKELGRSITVEFLKGKKIEQKEKAASQVTDSQINEILAMVEKIKAKSPEDYEAAISYLQFLVNKP